MHSCVKRRLRWSHCRVWFRHRVQQTQTVFILFRSIHIVGCSTCSIILFLLYFQLSGTVNVVWLIVAVLFVTGITSFIGEHMMGDNFPASSAIFWTYL